MNIVVYLGSCEGSDPRLMEAVRELGTWIGESGNTLIYGGSRCGLMGALAESALRAGADVIGIEPKVFVDQGLVYEEITQLIVTGDMRERRGKMIEMGDAFIAFPGGTGTLEEISEVMSLSALDWLRAPCILYNLDGYYADIRRFLEKVVEKGLSAPERLKGIRFADTLEEIKALLNG